MTDDIRTKKLMNAPEDIIPEAIEGMLSAHPDLLRVRYASHGTAPAMAEWGLRVEGWPRTIFPVVGPGVRMLC